MDQIKAYQTHVPGWRMYNSLLGGKSPSCDHATLSALGFAIDVHPLSLLPSVITAQKNAVQTILTRQYGRGQSEEAEATADNHDKGERTEGPKEKEREAKGGTEMSFAEVCETVGFPRYRDMEARYQHS